MWREHIAVEFSRFIDVILRESVNRKSTGVEVVSFWMAPNARPLVPPTHQRRTEHPSFTATKNTQSPRTLSYHDDTSIVIPYEDIPWFLTRF
jgi:hypothetical protein